MTKEKLAALLNGRQYTKEITKQEQKQAAAHGLVAIFGGSDDLCEFAGAISDEVGAPREADDPILISGGKLLPEVDRYELEVIAKHGLLEELKKQRSAAIKVFAFWDQDGHSWVIESTAEYAPFDIMEDDDQFCRGIVIDLSKN